MRSTGVCVLGRGLGSCFLSRPAYLNECFTLQPQQHHAHTQRHSILARKPLEGACAPLGIITLEDVLELMLGVRAYIYTYGL